jgi:HlyD family secretion protein
MLTAMTSGFQSRWRVQRQRLQQRWDGLSDHDQVGACLAGVGGVLVLWALFWPVPTEVSGQGVFIYPNNAGVLNARAGGQVLQVPVTVGQSVRKGEVLMTLYLPVLEKQLAQQKGNLAQLQRINSDLDRRDLARLETEKRAVDVALAKLDDDSRRYGQLQDTYRSKVRNLEWLSRREVVAPLSTEVVSAEQGLTNTSVNLDGVKIDRKKVLTSYEQVKLNIETEALNRRYQIDDLKRQIRVTEAKIAYDGSVIAEREGTLLDLQVIPGQTVSTGQRLGTIGRPEKPSAKDPELRAVAYFSPADARRLPLGHPARHRRRRVDHHREPPAGQGAHQEWTGDARRNRTRARQGQQRWLPLDPLRGQRGLPGA